MLEFANPDLRQQAGFAAGFAVLGLQLWGFASVLEAPSRYGFPGRLRSKQKAPWLPS